MWLRWLEYTLVFWLLPCVLFIFHENLAAWAIPILLLVTSFSLFLLAKEQIMAEQWRKAKTLSLEQLKPLLLPFLVLVISIGVLTFFLVPDKLFDLPINHPSSWLLILLLYPVISVLPQELLFRTFFFHRYKPLFASKPLRALLSASSFGFAHIIYGNVLAVILSFFAGLFFSYRYIQTKSLIIVSIEHSLWGAFVFTIGLGSYFIAHNSVYLS